MYETGVTIHRRLGIEQVKLEWQLDTLLAPSVAAAQKKASLLSIVQDQDARSLGKQDASKV
jgi:hypothetical protein